MKETYILELYVRKNSIVSRSAQKNLESVLEALPDERYRVNVIDIDRHPELCEKRKLLVVPTLIKVKPSPAERLCGSFEEKEKIAMFLGLSDKLSSSEGKKDAKDRRGIVSKHKRKEAPGSTIRDAKMGAVSGRQLLRDVIAKRR